jgi:hypothetical protein
VGYFEHCLAQWLPHSPNGRPGKETGLATQGHLEPLLGVYLVYDNVQRFSFGGAAAQTGPRGFRSWDPRR